MGSLHRTFVIDGYVIVVAQFDGRTEMLATMAGVQRRCAKATAQRSATPATARQGQKASRRPVSRLRVGCRLPCPSVCGHLGEDPVDGWDPAQHVWCFGAEVRQGGGG